MISRRRQTEGYFVAPNSVVDDASLSFEARGMHAYLLSKPDNWRVNIDDLRRAGGGIGEQRAYRILNELVAARKVTRKQCRDGSGRVLPVEYIVFDVAPISPHLENPDAADPDAADPHAGFQGAYKELKEENTETTKHRERDARAAMAPQLSLIPMAEQPPAAADAFETWWEVYPEKVGKGAARKAFERAAKRVPVDTLIGAVRRYITSKPADRAWCHPSTWLNQERWLDQPAEQQAVHIGDWAMTQLRKELIEGGHHRVIEHQH